MKHLCVYARARKSRLPPAPLPARRAYRPEGRAYDPEGKPLPQSIIDSMNLRSFFSDQTGRSRIAALLPALRSLEGEGGTPDTPQISGIQHQATGFTCINPLPISMRRAPKAGLLCPAAVIRNPASGARYLPRSPGRGLFAKEMIDEFTERTHDNVGNYNQHAHGRCRCPVPGVIHVDHRHRGQLGVGRV